MEQLGSGPLNVIEHKQDTETALRESEKLFRALFEQATVGVAEIDAFSGRFIRVNQKYSDITGYTIPEMLNLDFQTITHAADLAEDLHNMKLLVEGRIKKFSMEKRYCRKDGKIVWVHLTVSPLWAGHETPSHHMAIVQDITERKQAEEILAESEERYRRLFESATYAVLTFDAATLQCEDANPAARDLFGFSEQQLLDRKLMDFCSDARTKDTFETVAEGNRALDPMSEHRFSRRDGSFFFGEVSFGAFLARGRKKLICAIRNVTARREVQRRLQERYRALQSLHDISEVMLVSSSIETMAESVLDKALPLAACDWGLLRLENRENEKLEVVAHRGYRDEKNLLRHSSYQRERITGRVLRVFEAKRTFVLERVREEPGLRVLKSEGIESAVVIPVFLETEIFGLLQIGSRTPRKFEPTLIEFLETLVRYFCVAVQKQRLLAETLAGQAQLRELSGHLVAAQEDERRRIARELHDEFGSLLTGLKFMLAANDDAANSREIAIVDDLLKKSRYLSQSLRPMMLDDFGLLDTLKWYLREFTAQSGVRVDFQHSGLAIRMAPEIEITAFRIVQEALTNVARHAQVHQAMVSLSADQHQLSLEIADRGVGFDAAMILAQASSAGLSGMRERSRMTRGTFKVTSATGAGTRISVEIPLNNQS